MQLEKLQSLEQQIKQLEEAEKKVPTSMVGLGNEQTGKMSSIFFRGVLKQIVPSQDGYMWRFQGYLMG